MFNITVLIASHRIIHLPGFKDFNSKLLIFTGGVHALLPMVLAGGSELFSFQLNTL